MAWSDLAENTRAHLIKALGDFTAAKTVGDLISTVSQAVLTELSAVTATGTELNRLDDDNAVVATAAGAAWASAEYMKSSVIKVGGIYFTTIIFDLTGMDAIATDGDIIGKSTSNAAMGQITAARNGTIASMRVTCEEAPVGASADVDFFRATVATGKLDDAISGITGQATTGVVGGGSWTNGLIKCATAVPAANDYLYLTNGAGANAGTYSAGKFRIELVGY